MTRTSFSLLILLSVLMGACNKHGQQGGGPPPPGGNPPDTTLSASDSFLITAYVEVNSNDFQNPGCYVYGSPAKSAFEFAVIFAANINAVNGQATLYFNPQVQSTLNSAKIAYLKSLGIKVLLTVLGNHENAGWGCFTSYAAADSFAIQCANAVALYGLDGIDIDDEYSVCTTNANSLVLAVSALRSRLGVSKLITKALFNDTQYFSATYNGKKAGELLDYGWEMTYGQTNYSGRLQPYIDAGMAKSKLFIGVDIGGSDQAGAAQFVKKSGYGGVMTYNISNSSQANLSLITNVLFNNATSVKPGCLQ
jgi:GH18 family chitinase